MKHQSLSILAGVSLLLGLGIAPIFGGQEANAQQTPVRHNSTTEGFQGSESDPMFGDGGGDFNPFNLIHNANFSNGRSMGQFQQDTKRQLNRASEDFRRQQLERIREQMNAQPETTAPEAEPES
ncbi:hypothetical protein [Spirulina sp. 06S082]|uniref:hypothetical protein n=1 Tax=Spirulina sp. 06S082 TaxID=3110248 RepID=UPI002B200E23|nr:hypothetical protein [Spirulina sp. 06S082]MEA5470702.1 hypothetical protein [Spirulina sp. 06S082]